MSSEAKQLEVLHQFIHERQAELNEADDSGEARFSDILDRSMAFLNLSAADLAVEFGVSESIVLRWRDGLNAPYPAERPLVYDFLRKRAALAALNVQYRLRRVTEERA